MPYIPISDRKRARKEPSNVGELTFVLTDMILEYLEHCNIPPRFQDYAEVLGALEATKLELYRRRIGPFEDEKCETNGDVF